MSLTTVPRRPAPLVCLGEYIATGKLTGYEPGIPDPVTAVATLDRDEATSMTCEHCGQQTVSYRPFIRQRGGRVDYRGYGRCRTCGHTVPL